MTSMVKLCFPGLLCVLLFGAVGCDDDAPCDDVTCGANANCDVDTGECLCDSGFEMVEGECVELECLEDVECDDGDPCNGVETCGDDGTCAAGTPVDCGANGSCDSFSGECICDAGYELVEDECVAAGCTDAEQCDDGDPCNGVETCGEDGECVEGTPVDCGEHGICEADSGECVCDTGWVWVEEVETCLEVMAPLDDLELEEEGFYNGLDEAGSFTSGSVTFYNAFDTEYSSWDGFAYSNMTDTTTSGYENQYSTIAGGGAQDSENYAVAYVSDFSPLGPPTLEIGDGTATTTLAGLYVTNTTYAYLAMHDGDDYSKQFGGETGEDPDWFLLTIHGFDESGTEVGTVEVYLADFQSDVADEDYILDDWTWVDLSSLGEVASLQFTLTSSDVGDYGMNTPAYFALDSILR